MYSEWQKYVRRQTDVYNGGGVQKDYDNIVEQQVNSMWRDQLFSKYYDGR